jgi:hypothetical protein
MLFLLLSIFKPFNALYESHDGSIPGYEEGQIDGEFPLNLRIILEIGEIDGDIPPICMKNHKKGYFSCCSRKTSPYLTQNEQQSQFYRKISAYFLCLSQSLNEGKGILLSGLILCLSQLGKTLLLFYLLIAISCSSRVPYTAINGANINMILLAEPCNKKSMLNHLRFNMRFEWSVMCCTKLELINHKW